MKNKFLYIVSAVLIGAIACMVVNCKDNKVKEIAVFNVSLNKGAITFVCYGESEQLLATIMPTNATIRDVTWSSSNEAVAMVNDEGWVIAKGKGECVITVTTVDGGKTAQCTVNIPEPDPALICVPVTGISLEEKNLTLYTDQKMILTPIIEPADATNQNVIWRTRDVKVASVAAGGEITATGKGKTVITVTTVNGEYKDSCNIEVLTPIVAIGSYLETVEIIVGQKQILTVTPFPLDAENRNVSWRSGNENIAAVDANGLVTAVTVGDAEIIVTAEGGGVNNITKTILVKVLPTPPQTNGFVKTYHSKFVRDGKEVVLNGMAFYHGNTNGPPSSSFGNSNYARMAAVGFNCIRLYVSAKNFENSDASATPYREQMFTWLDNHLTMAQNNNLMVVLAMIHSPLANSISDRELFTDVNRQTRLANLWGEIAKRYKDNKTIVAFDLTNEPTARVTNAGGAGAPYNCVGTPYLQHFTQYQGIIQNVVDAIRGGKNGTPVNNMNHIIMPERLWLDGGHYSFAIHDQRDCWQNVDGKFNFPDLDDPANNYAYTYHIYEPNTYTHQDPTEGNNIYPSAAIGRHNVGPNNVPPWTYCKEYMDYAYTVPLNYIWNVKNVPAYIGELGIFTTNFNNNRGGAQWIEDSYDILLNRYKINCNFHPYYIHEITNQFDPRLEAAFKKAFGKD